MKKQQKGFTLIELLVVIAIIGILTAIGIASFTRAQKKARDARRQADLEAIQDALELYYADNQEYPLAGGGTFDVSQVNTATETYMRQTPLDPLTEAGYNWSITQSGQCYCVSALLEAQVAGTSYIPPCTPTGTDNYAVSCP